MATHGAPVTAPRATRCDPRDRWNYHRDAARAGTLGMQVGEIEIERMSLR